MRKIFYILLVFYYNCKENKSEVTSYSIDIEQFRDTKSSKELIDLIQDETVSNEDKFHYLCFLSKNYRDAKNHSRALYFAKKALKMAREEKSLKKEIIAYDLILLIYSNNSSNKFLKKIIDISNYCTKITKNTTDKEIVAYVDCMNAYKYLKLKDNKKYIYYMLKSLAYFEKAKKRYDKLVMNYGNLGSFFGEKNDLITFKKYVKKSLQLAEESKNDICLANGLTSWGLNIGYEAQNYDPVNKILIDSAQKCISKAIKLFENSKNKDILKSYQYGRSCANLTSIMLRNFNENEKSKLFERLKVNESICKKINDFNLLMIAYGQFTEYYTKTGQHNNAEETLKKVEYFISKQKDIEPRYISVFHHTSKNLAELKNDFTAYKKHSKAYDENTIIVNSKENKEREYVTTIKFETEQKNLKIKSLEQSVIANRKINYLLISLTILSIISILLIYKYFYLKKKNLEQMNQKTMLQMRLKEEEFINAELERDIAKNEMQMALQEKLLTEQQKERLQHELMTNNLQLEKKNEIIKEIEEKIKLINSTELKSIHKSIHKSMEMDEEFELLKSSFENTNPNFFNTLQQKASNNLTKLDLKYCGYIKLGMGIKEIANIMNIEPKSMRMARYRIRQKLKLDKDDDLDDFINKI